jgi:gluconolactonase
MKLLHTFIMMVVTLLAVRVSGFLKVPRAPGGFQLQAESSQFWNLVHQNAKLSVVGTGFGFTEGPVWDEAGFLYVSD